MGIRRFLMPIFYKTWLKEIVLGLFVSAKPFRYDLNKIFPNRNRTTGDTNLRKIDRAASLKELQIISSALLLICIIIRLLISKGSIC